MLQSEQQVSGHAKSGPAPRRVTNENRRRLMWFTFVLPGILLSGALLLYPFLDSIRLSFFEWGGVGDKTYVGTDNYNELVRDKNAWMAIRNTTLFAIANAVFTVGIGGGFALAINRKVHGARLLKYLIFLPVLLPAVFISLVWMVALDGNFGWFNDILGWIHPSLPRGWLGEPSWVLPSVMLVSTLQWVGFPMVILLAALDDVLPDIHEAATLDGVNGLQRAWHISIPSIREVISTIFLVQLMFGFRVFDQVFVMTGGGPGRVSEVATTFVYREGFLNRRFGYATSQAVVTAVLIAVVSMVYVSVVRPRSIEKA